jgi:hypothetical protein
MQAESSQHFEPTSSGDGQSATFEIASHPFSFQGQIQQGRTHRAANMRPFPDAADTWSGIFCLSKERMILHGD